MGFERNLGKMLLFFVLGGCATVPTGPSVMVLPSAGKSFETFNVEYATCRRWAEQRIGAASAQVAEQNTVIGAVAGTAIGTGLGALLGSASGHAGAGALIGAASGLVIGSASGASSGETYGWEAQRRYDNAYLQCMYSYGNQLPGSSARAASAPARPVAAPPPENYAAPEALYLDDAPQFVYSADLGYYVAVGVPYDLVYNGSEYFYHYRGRWYRSPFYNGPWRYVGRRAYSSPVFRFKIDNIHYYRDAEYRRLERDRDHYAGRVYRPEYRGERRRSDHR